MSQVMRTTLLSRIPDRVAVPAMYALIAMVILISGGLLHTLFGWMPRPL